VRSSGLAKEAGVVPGKNFFTTKYTKGHEGKTKGGIRDEGIEDF